MEATKKTVDRLLETIVIFLMLAMFFVIVAGVTFRKLGASLEWYDEVAEILLAWLTYYGAAYAALKRSHIGVPTLVVMAPLSWRKIFFFIAEGTVFVFFLILAWIGARILPVLEFDFLTTLPSISTMYTQSVIPIGAILFMIGHALSLPDAWRKTVTLESEPDSH